MTLGARMAVAALTLMILTGCAPSPKFFYYLSFASVEGIEVLEHGVVDSFAFFHQSMPTRYRLVRDTYQIEITYNSDSGSPSVWLKATRIAGPRLALEQSRDDRCDSWSYFRPLEQIYEFNWWTTDHCLLEGEIAVERQVLGLVVMDAADNVLGREQLPFEVVKNGVIIGIDAI